jgi:hypothetical protein
MNGVSRHSLGIHPLAPYGILTAIASYLITLMRETKGEPTRDEIQECEDDYQKFKRGENVPHN